MCIRDRVLFSEIAHKSTYLPMQHKVNIFKDEISIGEHNKSVTFSIIFQHPAKTLEDKDVNFVINEIIKVISNKYSAKLR